MAAPTVTDVQNLLTGIGIDLDPAMDLDLQLAASLAEILLYLRRSYSPFTGIRFFNGTNREYLWVDSFLSISAIDRMASDNTVIETLDPETYQALPQNSVPKTYIRRVSTGDLTWGDPALLDYYDYPADTYRHSLFRKAYWSIGALNYRITGTWGDDGDYPADVRLAIAKHAALAVLGVGIVSVTGGVVEWSEKGISTERWDPTGYGNAIRSWSDSISSTLGLRKKRIMIL